MKKQTAPKFKVGQTWDLRLKGNPTAMRVRIIDRTPKVVEVTAADFHGVSSLYAIADLEFVQKLTG